MPEAAVRAGRLSPNAASQQSAQCSAGHGGLPHTTAPLMKQSPL